MTFSTRVKEFLLGPKIETALPPHVKEAIKQQQMSSEKLIGVMQLAFLFVFGISYNVLPEGYPEIMRIAFIPVDVLFYLIFTLIRLFLSYRYSLPAWYLFFSIIVDIAFLMVMVWFTHIQYSQPASFYLKVPGFIAIFLFISIRVVRFEAKYVIASGVAAVIGWCILLIYAIKTRLPGTITQNYVQYMTSNDILIEAELDKILMIIIATAILALAVVRGRRFLIRSISETIATKELSKFFVPELATRIIQAGQEIKPGYGEQRSVAILHCDIRGFTELSKRYSTKLLMQLLTEYQSRIVHIIREGNGSIDKFLGDGILASFNAIKNDETYVADALRAAHTIVNDNLVWNKERLESGKETIQVGVTVSTGTVILGIVGDSTRLEYTVIGNPVNEAAKLDKQCKIEHCQALTTEEAFKKGLEQGYKPPSYIENRPGRKVSGIQEPVNLVILEHQNRSIPRANTK